MRIIFTLLLLLLLPANLFAQEYIPHARLTFKATTELRAFSGTAIESPDDTIKVITCWHGTMGFQSPKTITAEFFQPAVGNTQLSAKVELSVIKSDPDKDILLLSGPNTLKLKIKKLKLATDQLSPNISTKSYGYTELSTRLITNDSSVRDYNSTTERGFPILFVNAQAVSGMSGGGLIHDDVLYGVQSAGSNGKVAYCPADQVTIFIKD